MLRVAVLNRADFEWGVHLPAYLDAGGTVEKTNAIKNLQIPEDVFTQEELALIKLTDQSTLRVEVEEEVISEVKAIFGETQAVEAVATVAAYNMVSRFLVALAV